MKGQKFYKVYSRLLAGALISLLLSSQAAQAMPGMTAAEATGEARPSVAEAAVFADYEPIYRQHCAVCHGDKGDGKSRAQHGLKPPPRNFTTVEAWRDLSRERMVHSVTHGRPNTAMVGWEGRLDEAEIEGVVGYIRSAFMRSPERMAAQQETAATTTVPVLNSSKRAGSSGRDIYKRNCSACHGDKGNGSTWTQNGLNPPPRDFTADEARAYLTRERMITSVTHGREGTAMVSFSSRLSAEEIGQVVDYIRGDFMRIAGVAVSAEGERTPTNRHAATPHVSNHATAHPERETTAGAMPLAAGQHQAPARAAIPSLIESDMTLQLPHGLVGDVAAGQAFYAANCATCHGVRGDGHGPRSSFITPRPRNFLGERARTTLNRPALFRAIATGLPGTVMPAWSKVLNNQEIANLTEFVFQAFIQRENTAQTLAPIAAEGDLPGKSLPSSVERSVGTSTTPEQASHPAPE